MYPEVELRGILLIKSGDFLKKEMMNLQWNYVQRMTNLISGVLEMRPLRECLLRHSPLKMTWLTLPLPRYRIGNTLRREYRRRLKERRRDVWYDHTQGAPHFRSGMF